MTTILRLCWRTLSSSSSFREGYLLAIFSRRMSRHPNCFLVMLRFPCDILQSRNHKKSKTIVRCWLQLFIIWQKDNISVKHPQAYLKHILYIQVLHILYGKYIIFWRWWGSGAIFFRKLCLRCLCNQFFSSSFLQKYLSSNSNI